MAQLEPILPSVLVGMPILGCTFAPGAPETREECGNLLLNLCYVTCTGPVNATKHLILLGGLTDGFLFAP